MLFILISGIQMLRLSCLCNALLQWIKLSADYWSCSTALSSSVYSPFSDRVGFPPHNTPFPRVLMKSIGAVFLRPDALPVVNHMRGMQYQIVINIIFMPEIN